MAILDAEVQATKTKNLKPHKSADGSWINKGFVLGKLVDVTVVEQDFKKGEFADLKVPKLLFHFENASGDIKEIYTDAVGIPSSKKYEVQNDPNSNLIDRDEKDVTKEIQDMYKRIKHFLDTYSLKPNYASFASLTAAERTEYLNLPEFGTPGERIAAYSKFFNFVASFFKGTFGKKAKGLPVYQLADGNAIPVWMIMLPNTSGSKPGSYYEIPKFIQTGVLECVSYSKDPKTAGQLLTPKSLELNDLTILELKKGAKKADAIENAAANNAAAPPSANMSANLMNELGI